MLFDIQTCEVLKTSQVSTTQNSAPKFGLAT